jgi:DNA invertase Pin-like site-specific DNA recombinase
MGMIGYARCSTIGQDLDLQLKALNAAGVAPECTFSEHISGIAPFGERLQLQAALNAAQPGDELILRSLDRLGRTMEECVSRVAELLDRDVHVRTLDGRVNTLGLGKMAKLVVGILAAAAEIERELILERTAAGREKALDAGVKFGRKRQWSRPQLVTVVNMRKEGLGYKNIAKAMGLTVAKVRRMLDVAVEEGLLPPS